MCAGGARCRHLGVLVGFILEPLRRVSGTSLDLEEAWGGHDVRKSFGERWSLWVKWCAVQNVDGIILVFGDS